MEIVFIFMTRERSAARVSSSKWLSNNDNNISFSHLAIRTQTHSHTSMLLIYSSHTNCRTYRRLLYNWKSNCVMCVRVRPCEWVKAYKIENWSIYVKENTCYVLAMQYNRSIQYNRLCWAQCLSRVLWKCAAIPLKRFNCTKIRSFHTEHSKLKAWAVYELIQNATNIQSNCFYCWKLRGGEM